MSKEHVDGVLKLVIGRLEDETWTEVDDLNECEEHEAALNMICTELVDNDVSITREIYDRIRSAAQGLGLGDSPHPLLESLIRD